MVLLHDDGDIIFLFINFALTIFVIERVVLVDLQLQFLRRRLLELRNPDVVEVGALKNLAGSPPEEGVELNKVL